MTISQTLHTGPFLTQLLKFYTKLGEQEVTDTFNGTLSENWIGKEVPGSWWSVSYFIEIPDYLAYND